VFFWLFSCSYYNSVIYDLLFILFPMTKLTKTVSPFLLRTWATLMLLLIWFFVTLIRADSIPFQSSLPSIFSSWSWWFNPGYYSNTHFKYGGNNFVGIIFRQDSLSLTTPQTITIQWWSQELSCTKQLRWIYYNNQRWWRIWPLNESNLHILTWAAVWYDTMTITWWFYTNCIALSGAHTPATNAIYGQIDHTFGGETFRMIAWVSYDFGTNSILWATWFAATLSIATWGIHTGHIFDTHGWIAELTMNMPRCGYYTVSPSSITAWSDTTFICNANSVSGYIFRIHTPFPNSILIYETTTTQTGTRTIVTGEYLSPGDYVTSCTILGAGWTPWAACPEINLQVTWALPPPSTSWTCNPNFQWEISFAPHLSGDIVINPQAGTYYTNKTGVIIQRSATEPNTVVLSGDMLFAPWTWNYTGNNIFNYAYGPFTLTQTNNWNYIMANFGTGWCTYTDALKRIYVDTVAPTAPSITYPSWPAYLCPSLPLQISWIPSTDDWGISHYAYTIYNNSGMITWLVASGTFVSTTTSWAISLSSLPLWTYYINISAVDYVGNRSTSQSLWFSTSQSYCAAGTGIMIVTPNISITNANLDTLYRSQPIYVLWLTWPSLLSISHGNLLINNGTGIGKTGMVTSHDTLYIELISSSTYASTVSSTISVLWYTWTFSITTKSSACSLSAAEKIVIQNMYQQLKAQYNNDINKLTQFLTTFASMVRDEVQLSKDCNLEYLLWLIEQDIWSSWWIDTRNHITPNCKEYTIAYDTSHRAYYSPNTMKRFYFVNRESLIRHLDSHNPWDCHINTYGVNTRVPYEDPMKHTAPNGKVYHLLWQYWWFSAEEFISPKYFDSLESIKHYINIKNPAAVIWNHTLDISFLPITYAAPNGKEYRILKTNRWYMSYKLMKVQYFTSLGELKTHIDKNNPSQR